MCVLEYLNFLLITNWNLIPDKYFPKKRTPCLPSIQAPRDTKI